MGAAVTLLSLVDKKKVIITEMIIRSNLKLDDAEVTYCLPTATIFTELERMGLHPGMNLVALWHLLSCLATNKNFNFSKYIFDNMVKNLEGGVKFLMYPRFVQVFLDKQVEGMSRHKGIYVIPSHTKKVFANMKRPGKGFSRMVTPLFNTMMVQATVDIGEDSAALTNSHSTPIHTQPSSSKPQKKKSRRKLQGKGHGEDRMQLTELMDLYTQLQLRVLALETTKSNQALEIESLKRRVKSFGKRRRKVQRTPGFQENTGRGCIQKGRKITDLDADAEVTLVDETQKMNDDNLMFDTDVLEEQEKEVAKKEVSAADPVTTGGEVVTTTNVEVTTVNALTITINELTLAQTLIEIKAGKPKAVTSAATTTTTTRPKARGVAKDKGKEKMVEPEKPLKKKDQIAMDEEIARNLEAQLQAELEEEERGSILKEEKAKIDLLESWDNTQAMMDADFQLAQQMQTEEQEQLSIEENKTEGKFLKEHEMELESDNSTKQKHNEHVEAEKDDGSRGGIKADGKFKKILYYDQDALEIEDSEDEHHSLGRDCCIKRLLDEFLELLAASALRDLDDIVKEVHNGLCGFNAEPRLMVVRITKQGYYWPSMHQDAAKILQDCEKCKEQSSIKKVAESNAMTAGSGWSFSHWGVNILGPLPTAPADLYKGLKVTQSFSPIMEHTEIMNHIKKQLARSQQGWVDNLAQVLWIHRTLPRNSQKEISFSLTYDSEAIIHISETNVTKDDKGRIKEVDKRRGSKEIASIEEA
ncbi:hypothetical protein Tco_1246224 [Tanacetum coccineum]